MPTVSDIDAINLQIADPNPIVMLLMAVPNLKSEFCNCKLMA